MPITNPFSAFQTRDINAAINLIPNQYGLLGTKNVFPIKGTTKTVAEIELKDNTLALLPVTARGGQPSVGAAGKRRLKAISIPQIAHEDLIHPEDVDGVRAFGGNAQLALQALLADRMQMARIKHDQTLEFMRMSALKGVLVDSSGATLVDTFTEFGVTKKTVNFALTTATTNVLAKCLEVARHIEDNVMGDVMRGVEVLVSRQFFEALTDHAKVKEAFANYQEASTRLGGDLRKGFTFGGITFIEYNGAVAGRKLIEDGMGHAYPSGTNNTFNTFVAPADFNETVGSLGQLFYAKVTPAKNDRGYELHTQANPLPLCMRPGALVELIAS